jgi:poly(hydroxyalkanoate) depolymerase family esterase
MKRSSWSGLFRRNAAVLRKSLAPLRARRKAASRGGDWQAGWSMGTLGARRYWIFRPDGMRFGEPLPLLVMLHGCRQDAASFAASTRMNTLAARDRFLVLYPEQDRLSNPQGCWNWFDNGSAGRAPAEAAAILRAVEQACLLYGADRERIAIAGLSAGASMAALLATLHPQRFKAVAMHSGVPPGLANSTLSAVKAMRGQHAASASAAAAPSKTPLPPLLVIHGSNDAVVSIHNAGAAAQQWQGAAGAREQPPRQLQRCQRHPMTVTDFTAGPRLAAQLVRIEGLGHAWSGGAARQRFSDPLGPDASRLIWRFMAKQFAADQLTVGV